MNSNNESEVDLMEELLRLTAEIGANSVNDEAYYLRGRLYWRLGQTAMAISDFEHALAINPSSPAAAAVSIARDVMDFYNKDLYNP